MEGTSGSALREQAFGYVGGAADLGHAGLSKAGDYIPVGELIQGSSALLKLFFARSKLTSRRIQLGPALLQLLSRVAQLFFAALILLEAVLILL